MKAAGLNLLRAARVRSAKMRKREATGGLNHHTVRVIMFFKERNKGNGKVLGSFTSTDANLLLAA
jgi:hypothetical protein